MTIVPTGCQERFLIWGSSRESLYGATSRLCCAGGDKSLSSQEGHIWTQAESNGVFEKFSLIISSISFHRCHSDHSVFVRLTKSGIVVLIVYIDDILLTGSDSDGLLETKRHFVTKNMRYPKYFLGIEVAHQKHSVLFPSESMLWIFLRKQDFLGCKAANTIMEANVDLYFDDSHTLDDPGRYKRLIENLIYLTVTRPDITFAVEVLNRFMYQPLETH